MCGIFAYAGNQNNAENIIFQGLKRLEYRGYDSWGISTINKQQINTHKQTGALPSNYPLTTKKPSSIGIGHTRWATHGGVTQINAHPHHSSDNSFAVAHNGIVENYQELKQQLQTQDHSFHTQTDTEVIVRLIEQLLKQEERLLQATKKAFKQLQGRNTIILVTTDNQLITARNGSPLLLGLDSADNSIYMASDSLAFANHTTNCIVLDNQQLAQWHKNNLDLYDLQTNQLIHKKPTQLKTTDTTITKSGYDHFMLKEIMEQPKTTNTIAQISPQELEPLVAQLKQSATIYTTGAGTANFAANQTAYFLRQHAKLNAFNIPSYEMGSYLPTLTANDTLIAFSQSGETADTLEAIEQAQVKGVAIASIVNMPHSSITRASDFQHLLHAGPEICVLSTKTFTAKVCWGYLLSQSIQGQHQQGQDNINKLADALNQYLNQSHQPLIKLADKLKTQQSAFILGKGQHYHIAREAALKIKEVSYNHYEAFSSGELKHGVIALIGDQTPVFAIISQDQHQSDLSSALQEVNARGAHTISITSASTSIADTTIPVVSSPQLNSLTHLIPFQLLGYYLAVTKKLDPDKPRNLAKSVTVK